MFIVLDCCFTPNSLSMNANQKCKGNDIISVLQAHFKGELNLARVKLICVFITALCKIYTINYVRLSCAFDSKADKGSSYRHIQRFMSEFNFPMRIISSLIFPLLPKKTCCNKSLLVVQYVEGPRVLSLPEDCSVVWTKVFSI